MSPTTSFAETESPSLRLRAGEWVEVLSKEEILATLDADGRLDNLPFMPEMFQYCGRKLQVFRRAHKTCDTVNKTGGRWMSNAVHLQEARCDGAAHGGCEAACLLFFKEAWVKRTSAPSKLLSIRRPPRASTSKKPTPNPARCTEVDVVEATRTPETKDSTNPSYVCQATALPGATTWLPWWDLRQYVEDYTSGNTTLTEMAGSFAFMGFFELIKVGERAGLPVRSPMVRAYDLFQKLVGGVPFPELRGNHPAGTEFPPCSIGVRPGDLVRVKSYEDILDTLDATNKNRGMYFGAEEVPFCGKTFRVRSSVKKIVDERTGRMIKLRGNSLILDGAWCAAHYADRRLFCPRAIFPFWREAWLEPAEPQVDQSSKNSAAAG
jgi:hypothetical protein